MGYNKWALVYFVWQFEQFSGSKQLSNNTNQTTSPPPHSTHQMGVKKYKNRRSTKQKLCKRPTKERKKSPIATAGRAAKRTEKQKKDKKIKQTKSLSPPPGRPTIYTTSINCVYATLKVCSTRF